MEHVLKTTRKILRPAHDSNLAQEGSNTAENNKTLAESKAHDSNWLEDCALEGHHHREANRSQTWPTKATWARTSAGVFT